MIVHSAAKQLDKKTQAWCLCYSRYTICSIGLPRTFSQCSLKLGIKAEVHVNKF